MVQSRASSPDLFKITPLPTLPHKGGGNRGMCLAAARSSFCCQSLPRFIAPAARAEVLKSMTHCAAQQQLCPYYQLVLTPPDGWVVDAKASAENKQMMVPKGQNFATAEPLIYVQVADRVSN